MSELRYFSEFGSYYLHDVDSYTGEKLGPPQACCDAVSIAYDAETLTLHKHGRPELVHTWARQARQRYLAAGFAQEAAAVCVLDFPAGHPVEDINRVVATGGGYLRALLGQVHPTRRGAP